MGKPVVSRKPGLNAVVTVALALVALAWLLSSSARGANPPHFDYIERPRSLTNFVLLHFETRTDTEYEIQYLNYFPTNGAAWSILATIPPGQGTHYIWADYMSSPQRFYRLKAIPF